LIDRQGYDEDTGLFAAFGDIQGYTSPSMRSTKHDAEKALEQLLELVQDFPAVGLEDRAAIIAGIITSLVRRILPAAPMVAITAPTPGTGKTLLAETFAIIATGRRASVLSLGHDDAEAEKRLAGVLLAGDACILLDNIERPLKGDLLCQVTTQQFVRLRPLGASGMVSIPTHALMVATGNNLSIVGDLKRRVALIRLDAKEERPEKREFKRDHLEWVLERRGELIRAALTISLAYLADGAPRVDDLHPLGGFELWDRMVRRPLVWLGMTDPLKAAEGLREQDPDLETMRLLFEAWLGAFPNGEATAAEVVTASLSTLGFGESLMRSFPDLYDAMQMVCAEKINSRRLAYWLRSHRDRMVDGMRLEQGIPDKHSKIARWKIVKCG
jgi:putative DNA primase/helicase